MIRELKVRNFRDVSGYRNRYGETMKPNMIFRGATLDQLTREDVAYMEEDLGIRYILDYRDEKEATLAKDIVFTNATYERIGALQLQQQSEDGFDFGALLQGEMTKEKLEFLMEYIREGYRFMPFNNPAYHRLFELLVRDDGHIYFHCSAGKDRTGISAFLIMLALGMSEEDGMEEYLLSNEYLKAYNDLLVNQLGISKEIEQYCAPLLYVQKENILLSISAIKEKYESYDDFLLHEYGLDEEKRKKLRRIYCTGDERVGV